MLDLWGEQVPHGWVTGDDELGRHTRFRRQLRERGEKGPVGIAMVTRRVQTRLERTRTGPAEWLVVTRRPLADDSMVEPQASRDAMDQDAGYRYQSSLTPTWVSKVGKRSGGLRAPNSLK